VAYLTASTSRSEEITTILYNIIK